MLYNPTVPEEEPMRRRRMFATDEGPGGTGSAGPEQTLARLLPFLLGLGSTNMAGLPSGIDLSALSAQARMGGAPDFRNVIAGPNPAPGAPGGLSGNQPTPPPGITFQDPSNINYNPADRGAQPAQDGPRIIDPIGHNPQGPIGSRPGRRDGRMPGNPAGTTFSRPTRRA